MQIVNLAGLQETALFPKCMTAGIWDHLNMEIPGLFVVSIKYDN